MNGARLHPRSRTLERGRISFFRRPRIDHGGGQPSTVQRLLMLLEPDEGPVYRLIAIGRKIRPANGQRRFWGFVDAVLNDRRDLTAVLDTYFYRIPGKGLLHVPAAVEAGCGRYALQQDGADTHLIYGLDSGASIERAGDLVIHVANPDPAAWGLSEPADLQSELFDEAEIHAPLPALLPTHLQQRFGGRASTPLDATDWMDQPGAELLFRNGAE